MMPEEVLNQIRDLARRVEMLEAENRSLKNVANMSYENDGAFRDRFKLNTFIAGNSSSKAAASEGINIDEGGSGMFTVAQLMDGFIIITLNGTDYNVPYYNA